MSASPAHGSRSPRFGPGRHRVSGGLRGVRPFPVDALTGGLRFPACGEWRGGGPALSAGGGPSAGRGGAAGRGGVLGGGYGGRRHRLRSPGPAGPDGQASIPRSALGGPGWRPAEGGPSHCARDDRWGGGRGNARPTANSRGRRRAPALPDYGQGLPNRQRPAAIRRRPMGRPTRGGFAAWAG